MVVATPTPIRSDKIEAIDLPIIDLSGERSEVSKLIVRACEEFGFFKVINHGVPFDIISKVEQESLTFFSKPIPEKQMAGPPNPFGYGFKNIGFNGDMGEVEYILLHTNPLSISQCSKTFSNDPSRFRYVYFNFYHCKIYISNFACSFLFMYVYILIFINLCYLYICICIHKNI